MSGCEKFIRDNSSVNIRILNLALIYIHYIVRR